MEYFFNKLKETKIGNRLSDFAILKQLGKGSYATVYTVLSHVDSKIYAMKKMDLNHLKPRQQNECYKEVSILRKLNHPNIIKYYSSFLEKDCLYIIMEYAELGDLYSLIKHYKKHKKNFEEFDLWRIAYEILNGLEYLHTHNIIHRDIKCLNLFITKDKHIKIGDLGVSTIISGMDNMHNTRVGTPLYLSPELIKQIPYDYKIDIWSFGCSLYHLAALEPPFSGNNLIVLGNNIVRNQPKELSNIYSDDFKYFVKKMLSKKPEKRPSAHDAKEMIPNDVKDKILFAEKNKIEIKARPFSSTKQNSNKDNENISNVNNNINNSNNINNVNNKEESVNNDNDNDKNLKKDKIVKKDNSNDNNNNEIRIEDNSKKNEQDKEKPIDKNVIKNNNVNENVDNILNNKNLINKNDPINYLTPDRNQNKINLKEINRVEKFRKKNDPKNNEIYQNLFRAHQIFSAKHKMKMKFSLGDKNNKIIKDSSIKIFSPETEKNADKEIKYIKNYEEEKNSQKLRNSSSNSKISRRKSERIINKNRNHMQSNSCLLIKNEEKISLSPKNIHTDHGKKKKDKIKKFPDLQKCKINPMYINDVHNKRPLSGKPKALAQKRFFFDLKNKINKFKRPLSGFNKNDKNSLNELFNVDMNRRFLAPDLNPLKYKNIKNEFEYLFITKNEKSKNFSVNNLNSKEYKNSNEFLFKKFFKEISENDENKKKLTVKDI